MNVMRCLTEWLIEKMYIINVVLEMSSIHYISFNVFLSFFSFYPQLSLFLSISHSPSAILSKSLYKWDVETLMKTFTCMQNV